MPADSLEFEQKLAEFEQRNSPEGLLLRYALRRPAYFWFRQIFMICGSLVLFLTGHFLIGLVVYLILITGELVDTLFLKTIPKQLARGVPYKRLHHLATATASFQSLTSVALAFFPVWLEGSPETLAFCFAFIAGGGINSSYLLSFHSTATYIRLSTLLACGIATIIYGAAFGTLGLQAQIYSVFALSMTIFLVFTFLQYSQSGFEHRTKSERRMLEQSLELAAINKTLHDQQSEVRRLALVARYANDSVIVADPKGHILWVNEAFTRITGYSSEEAIGKKTGALLDGPETAFTTTAAIESAIATGTPLRTELLNYRKDGTKIWVETNQVPIYNDAGQVEMIIAIERDVTADKYHMEELAVAKRAAEDGERAKTQFLATMSHEIRTPMNGIIGMADLLQDESLSKEQQGYVETIRYSAEALMRIINDILDFSKLDAGKSVINPVDFDLLGCVESALSILRPKAIEKGIFVKLNCLTPVPPLLRGDDGRIRQIVINVVGNAIKFTQQGGVTIDLSCYPSSEGNLVTLEVSDTGIGIAEDRVEQIFDQFSQADGDITRQYGGTGLGLTISRILAHEMGGDIALRSTLGTGSTFTITLELDHTLDALEVAAEAALDSLPSVKLPGMKALVAEDNLTNQLLIKKYLKDTEMDVVYARNGREAVRLALRHQPHVIFMDMSMPEMDGISATRKIRAEKALTQPKIVALTANVYASDKAACLSAGMDGFLSKPLKRSDLMGWLCQI
ncbi:ATP-binding protein [uncultured Lentibacter sp.]|uniref:ATP-binding protein n=1 Tax=uncultured Lentibacter sp. TaxID=1659309 RepID=UPI00260A759C|nr:ATP-binding protein [uncultured Lentibacter sp.]MCW1956078.1 ATP-binding protein [Roseobacter sp.]